MRLNSWGLWLAVGILGWYGLMMAVPRGERPEAASIRQVRQNLMDLQRIALEAEAEGRGLKDADLEAWARAAPWPAGDSYAVKPTRHVVTDGAWMVRLKPRCEHIAPAFWEQALFLDFRRTSMPVFVLPSFNLTLQEMYTELDEITGTLRLATYPPESLGTAGAIAQAGSRAGSVSPLN